MNSNDAMPEDVSTLVRHAAAGAPSVTWDVENVRRRGRRRRWTTPAGLLAALGRRRSSTIVTNVLALLLIGAGTVFAVGTWLGPSGDPSVRWAAAGDPDRLYALRSDCPQDRCVVRLMGSDDGGATWTERSDRVSAYGYVGVLGPSALYVQKYRPNPARMEATGKPADTGVGDDEAWPAVSADGGRTWHPVVESGRRGRQLRSTPTSPACDPPSRGSPAPSAPSIRPRVARRR